MAMFQRSTKKNSTGGYAYCDAKNARILTPDEMDASAVASVLAKLARYEELQESGRLHCFPCNIGECVYVRATFTSQGGTVVASAIEATVKKIIFADENKLVLVASFSDGTEIELAQGEFFSSKEAAIANKKSE